MLPIISIVGASDSGKTTFLEKLIPELAARRYRVGAIKHDAHGFEMDREGKDTWRLRRAGAEVIAILSPDQFASIRRPDGELSLEEIAARFFWTEDILITEGFKGAHFPKIEVFRSALEPKPICNPGDNLIALVSDDAVDTQVPKFSFTDCRGVAEFIENRYLRNKKKRKILVHLDGKKLPMKDFVGDFLMGGIKGMLSSLRGYDKPRTVSIHIRLGEDD
jgi:molybdopterin-guanine dinucleotide biosynthesis adapter protein